MKFADRIDDPTEDSERFQKELFEYLDEYKNFLREVKSLSKHTINTRCALLCSFIEYICLYHPVKGFEDIKFAWCSSGFASYERSHGDAINTKTSRNYIRDFFAFIYDQHRIANIRLLEKLKAAK